MAAKRDYYDVLGIDRNADEKTIKKINSALYNKECVEFRPVKDGIRIVRVRREVIGTIKEDLIDFTKEK